MLSVGSKAIDFTLPDKDGKMHKLSDFLGKKVILYFYPKDNTPGCSMQAQTFKKNLEEIHAKNAVVIGISKDSQASHLKFVEKYDLPFLLLSDVELEVIKAYEVWKEKKLYGKTYMGVSRDTYVIDENGIIEKVFEKVSPKYDTEFYLG